MPTAFTVTVMPSGGDYTTLNGAQSANACDLTAAATKVFAHGAITGTITDGATVTGLTSLATGVCTHCSATQILIKTITGTFQNGEIVYQTLSVNFITINDAGDSAIVGIKIDGDWSGGNDTTQVNISGYTNSATNYLNIYTSAQARHSGSYDSTKYVLIYSVAGDIYTLQVANSYVRITGLQILNNIAAGSNSRSIHFSDNGGGLLIDKCILIANRSAVYADFFGSIDWTIRNSVLVTRATGDGLTSTLYCRGVTSGNTSVLNCVIANFTAHIAVEDFGTPILYFKNCYAYSNGSTAFSDAGSAMVTTTCASNDGSHSTTTVAFSTSSGAYFKNVTSGSEDFHIGTSSSLKNAGTDLSSTFTDDIEGQLRPTGASTWDIGADEYGVGNISLNMQPKRLDVNLQSLTVHNASSMQFYNRFKTNLLRGNADFIGSGSHQVKCALVESTYTFNADNNFFTGISTLYEASGTGYTAGGNVLSNFTLVVLSGPDYVYLNLDDTSWRNATFSFRYAILYDNTLTTKDLIICIDFGQTYTLATNSGFLLKFPLNGLVLGLS